MNPSTQTEQEDASTTDDSSDNVCCDGLPPHTLKTIMIVAIASMIILLVTYAIVRLFL